MSVWLLKELEIKKNQAKQVLLCQRDEEFKIGKVSRFQSKPAQKTLNASRLSKL